MKLVNVFYGANINIEKNKKDIQKENIFTLYDNSDVNCYLSKRGRILYKEDNKVNTFISKSVSYHESNEKKISEARSMPPKGPIHEYTFCIFCKQKGPSYHTENCQGPYDYEAITPEGISFYADKINSVFSEDELDDIQQNKEFIFYKDLYQGRGIQLLLSEKYTFSDFSNVVQYKYVVSCDSNEMVVPIKVTPYYGITLRNVPYCDNTKFENFQKTIFEKIIHKFAEKPDLKIQKDYTWITNMNGIFKLCEEGFILNLETVNDQLILPIDELNSYDYIFSDLKGYIGFKYKVKKYKNFVKITVQIKRGGSVHLFISYDKDTIRVSDVINFNFLKKQAKKIYDILNRFHNIKIKSQQKLGIKHDAKIMNMSIPYKILKDEFKYDTNIEKVTFPPQPSGCQNKGLSGSNRLIKVNIRRPVPFSFSQGISPMRNMTLIDEGIKSNGVKLKGDRYDLVEPCSQMITGKESKLVEIQYSRNTNIMPNKFKECNFDFREIDDVINETTSVKNKMLRRAIYGFPNDKFPDDSAAYNKIQDGKEIAPKLLSDKKLDKNSISISDTITLVQEDINSAVYIPGTQLKNFEGDNTFIRDSRVFTGLIDRSKENLLNIVDHYLQLLHMQSNDKEPIDINDIDMIKKFTSKDKFKCLIVPYQATFEIINDCSCYRMSNFIYVINCKTETDFGNLTVNFPFEIKSRELENLEIQFYQKLIIISDDLVFCYSKDNSDILQNQVIQFYVEKNAKLPNTVLLKYPDESELESYLLIDKNLLFVPASHIKKLKENGVYKFYFNYYIDTDGVSKMVPNQPFILLDNFDKKGNYERISNMSSKEYVESQLKLLD